MKRCLIVGGAEIEDYEGMRQLLRADDYAIFCDSGLRHRDGLGIAPNLIIGDFDSHENPHMDVETIVLPREKDDTDSMHAARVAVERGFTSFLLLGMTGARLDHTLGNLSLLIWLDRQGKKAVLADDYGWMEMVSREPAAVEGDCKYFSVINFTGEAEGITIKNAKYPLERAEIGWEYQYGVSNEVLPGKTASVCTEKGSVLLLRIRKG